MKQEKLHDDVEGGLEERNVDWGKPHTAVGATELWAVVSYRVQVVDIFSSSERKRWWWWDRKGRFLQS